MRMIRPLLVTVLALAAAPATPQAAVGSAPLPIETVRIVAAYPHDRTAFTEGLLVHDGSLYESTGREGQSDIRRVDLASGRVIARATLPSRLFGEGIAAWKSTLVSVTWKTGEGFRWRLPDLRRAGTVAYAGEGWGMTSDDRHIILSDGTATLRFLDPVTFKVVRRLPVTARGRPLDQLNELELVDGEILANIWMTPYIARIDPATGAVRGFLDLTPLVERVGVRDPDAVANGIAWDAKAHALYVTGKNWPELFAIALPARAGTGNGGR